MKLTPTTLPPSCSTRPAIASTVPPVASTSSWITTRAPCDDRVGGDLERVLAVLERVGRAAPSRAGACRAAAPATKPQPASLRDRRAEDEAARLRAEHEVRLALRRPRRELVDRLRERLGVEQERRDVLEADARLREVRDLADAALQVDRAVSCADESTDVARRRAVGTAPAQPRRAPGGPRAPARRRSGFRERSAGATTASSSADSRSAAVRKARRWRGAMPKRASASHAIATSTSRLGVDALPPLDARLEQPELLELARALARDPGALAELVEVEAFLPRRRARSAGAGAACPRPARELLADHAQRQELVALQAQDRLEPLDVVLAEEPVAALRPPRRRGAPGPRGSGSSRSRCRGTPASAGGRRCRS